MKTCCSFRALKHAVVFAYSLHFLFVNPGLCSEIRPGGNSFSYQFQNLLRRSDAKAVGNRKQVFAGDAGKFGVDRH